MKTININEYTHDGELINLDEIDMYEKLLYNPSLYLDKEKKYYFYCKKGIKSKKVVSILEIYGYNVIRVIK